jgi:hypothetical protein
LIVMALTQGTQVRAHQCQVRSIPSRLDVIDDGRRFAAGDRLASNQTKHRVTQRLFVENLGAQLPPCRLAIELSVVPTSQVERRLPLLLTPRTAPRPELLAAAATGALR